MEENEKKRDPKVFGRNVRAFRILRGWGVRDLAAKCGVSTKTIVKIERGEGCTARTEQKISLGFAVFLGRLWDATLLTDERQRIIDQNSGRWFFGEVEDAKLFHQRSLRAHESADRLRSDPDEIQDCEERQRLGNAGFARIFVRSQGGGIQAGYFQLNQAEIYARDITPGDGFNKTYLMTSVEHGLRIGIRGQVYELNQGDSFVFEAADEYWIEPTDNAQRPSRIQFACLGILSLEG